MSAARLPWEGAGGAARGGLGGRSHARRPARSTISGTKRTNRSPHRAKCRGAVRVSGRDDVTSAWRQQHHQPAVAGEWDRSIEHGGPPDGGDDGVNGLVASPRAVAGAQSTCRNEMATAGAREVARRDGLMEDPTPSSPSTREAYTEPARPMDAITASTSAAGKGAHISAQCLAFIRSAASVLVGKFCMAPAKSLARHLIIDASTRRSVTRGRRSGGATFVGEDRDGQDRQTTPPARFAGLVTYFRLGFFSHIWDRPSGLLRRLSRRILGIERAPLCVALPFVDRAILQELAVASLGMVRVAAPRLRWPSFIDLCPDTLLGLFSPGTWVPNKLRTQRRFLKYSATPMEA